jgi:protein TonB
MDIACTKKSGSWLFLVFSQILVLLFCAGCGKNPSPANEPEVETPISPKATGLVKNPVKLSDTADAVKWMDMASAKSPAQIAKEEQLAKEASDAKLAAESRKAREDKFAADAKLATETKLAADAKALPAKVVEAPKAVSVVTTPTVVTPKAVAVVAQEPILKVISREQPKYPKNAALDGITSGVVTAQVHIEADGSVSKVDIVTASPKKYFDKAVIAAALHWKYAPISKAITTTLEFNFKLDGEGS